MKYKITMVVLTVILAVSLILNVVFYFQIIHLGEINRNNESQIQDLSQTLSDMIFSIYYQDIQGAVQRWIEVHGSPPEGVEVKPSYINTGDVAAWIDPTGNLEFQFKAGDFPSVYGPRYPRGLYWEGFPYPSWCHPPEVIAVWVQLYNKSSGIWSSGTDVFSRNLGDFAFYLVNSSAHKVIGIDGNYAAILLRDFRDNSVPNTLPNILGTPDYLLNPLSWGMCNDGSWESAYEILLKDGEWPLGKGGWHPAYDLKFKVDWKIETASIKMLKPK